MTIDGLDDDGEPPDAMVTLSLDAGAARTIYAQELESGGNGLSGGLGEGSGKWQLIVSRPADSGDEYAGAPVHGEAWVTGSQCKWHMRRGGSWTVESHSLRSARRNGNEYDVRGFWGGFRVTGEAPIERLMAALACTNEAGFGRRVRARRPSGNGARD